MTMETYTIIISLTGILALIALVAGLTFFDDGKKWLRFRFLKMRRKRASHLRTVQLRDKDQLFLDKEDSLFLKHLKENEKFHPEGTVEEPHLL
jgi:hypothetical protein